LIFETNQDRAETISKIQELALKILAQLTKSKLGHSGSKNPTFFFQTPLQAGSITQCINE